MRRFTRHFLGICAPGFQPAVVHFLREDLNSPKLTATEDGLVAFLSSDDVQAVKGLPYLNNCFEVIKCCQGVGAAAPRQVFSDVMADEEAAQALRRSMSSGTRSFRVFVSRENRTISCDPGLLRAVESWVSAQTGAGVNRHRADTELWLLLRRSGSGFFARRISKRAKTEKDLAKGELRPEVAYVLCRLSEPRPDDVFLDPFAGSGALPLMRARWPFELAFALDSDEEKVRSLRARVKSLAKSKPRLGKRLIVRVGDARQLSKLSDGFVSKIVTDPPWGLFDRSVGDVDAFYREWVGHAVRVLRPGGIMVTLSSQKSLMSDIIDAHAGVLELAGRYDVLVSGQKAAAFKVVRRDTRCGGD